LDLSAADFDVIAEVGENSAAFSTAAAGFQQGHILKLLTTIGKYYSPTGELTMEAFRRTLVADLSYDTGDPEAIADDFCFWLCSTYGVAEMLQKTWSFKPVTWYFRHYCGIDGAKTGETWDSRFDNDKISLPATIDAFCKVHDSELYQVAAGLERVSDPPYEPRHTEPEGKFLLLEHMLKIGDSFERREATLGSVPLLWQKVTRSCSLLVRTRHSSFGVRLMGQES
jgi:hypothetical protein